MAKLELFGGLGEIEVLALFAIIPNTKSRATSEREKTIGLEMLNLIEVGGEIVHINFLEDKYALVSCGYSEYDVTREKQLSELVEDYFNKYKHDLEVSQFELDDNDYVNYINVYIDKTLGTGTKDLRRFVFVKFEGEYLFTDIYGLNDGTRHIKKDRDRNTKGLQWENYAQLLKQGVVY